MMMPGAFRFYILDDFFKDLGSDIRIDQFDQKILDLEKLQHTLDLNEQQIRLMQANFMTKLNSIKNIVFSTYPIWKSNFATLLNRWQSTGNIKMDAEIDRLYDSDFNNCVDEHKGIVNKLISG